MKYAYAAAIAATLGFNAMAEQAYMAPLVTKSTLLDIIASDYVVAVGERGHVLTSDDGVTFTQRNVPTQSTLTAVETVGDQSWAVGHDAVILYSQDRGENWELQYRDVDLQRPFLDVMFLSQSHGIAVGAYGLFMRTRDGGQTWTTERHASLLDPYDREYLEEIRAEDEEFYQQELNSILPHLNRITRFDDNLYIAGESGLLAYSNDFGESWTRFEVDYTGSFFDIKPVGAEQLLAVGLRGNVFVKNGENEWQRVNTCNTSTLNSITKVNAEKVFATGNNGMVVSFNLPINGSPNPANPGDRNCMLDEGVNVTQTQDKAAILNSVVIQNNAIAVTADGLHTLNLD